MPTFTANRILSYDEEMRRLLSRFGFMQTTYEGIDGIFYTKTMLAKDMRYLSKEVDDDDNLSPDSNITTELSPDNMLLRWADLGTELGYPQYRVPLDSDEAFRMLRDARVEVAEHDLIDGSKH